MHNRQTETRPDVDPIKARQRKDSIEKRLKIREVFRICNALLRQQATCGQPCEYCIFECDEMRRWSELKGVDA